MKRRSLLFAAVSILEAESAMSATDLPNEEPGHPIPQLDVVDVHGIRKTGGSDLVIVIASPLRDDDHSIKRLLRKLDNYVAAISSKGYAEQFGAPSIGSTAIVVSIHPNSAPAVFELLERYRPKVEAAHASLKIQSLEPSK